MEEQEVLTGYTVEFTVHRDLSGHDDHPAVVDVRGSIGLEDDDSYDSTEVGEMSLILLRVSCALEGHYAMMDQCDAHSQVAVDYYCALFDDYLEVRPNVTKAVDDVIGLDVLIVNTVELQPAHRGRGVGLAAVYEAIDTFGAGCGLVALKPFPLQYDATVTGDPARFGRLGADTLGGSEAAATRKLATHWRKLGFRKLPRTPYLLMNLAFRRPSRADLGLL